MASQNTHAEASSLRRILEIGTGDAGNTLALAESLSPDGLLITIEPDAARAAAARQRLTEAGLDDRVSVIVGEPRRFVHKVGGPFDLIVQNDPKDADGLHDKLIALLRPGGVLIRGHRKYSVEG
jgi:caffeoyl-CoA O-methyltransferase